MLLKLADTLFKVMLSFLNLNISNLWMPHFYYNLLASKHSLARIPNIAKSQNHTCHYIRNKSITKLIFLPFFVSKSSTFFSELQVYHQLQWFVVCQLWHRYFTIFYLKNILVEIDCLDFIKSFHGYLGEINSPLCKLDVLKKRN